MRINIKIEVNHTKDLLENKIKRAVGVSDISYRVLKRSVDARGGRVLFVYTIEAVKKGEPFENPPRLTIPRSTLKHRPVVVGSGPCGLFCAYILAKAGAKPIVLERGAKMDKRISDVALFNKTGILNTRSNIQFGEGGAGTFSDGKLTTRINDPLCLEVLQAFVKFGAPDEILWQAKAHIGTDKLVNTVTAIRDEIIRLGGDVYFDCCLTDIEIKNSKVCGALTQNGEFKTDTIVLAIGHSARDTFEMLFKKGINMTPKAFSVGVRIEHPQSLINQIQYKDYAKYLGAADYSLSYHTKQGRGVYSFCMCPGGSVVAAASEEGMVVTNGMSLFARNSKNANSALLVSVLPDDFGGETLGGIAFQRELEHRAYLAGGGGYKAPAQKLCDFLNGIKSEAFGSVTPSYLPAVTPSDLNVVLPHFVTSSLKEAIPVFNKKMRGFALPDAVLTGVETRSSSPVRIVRDKSMQSDILGLYPAGEGAGYAGGIMSAAVDGIKCALMILEKGM